MKNTRKRTRQDNNGESASNQTKKTLPPIGKLARRFYSALDDVLEELDEHLNWVPTDGERIRLLMVRQQIGKLREAALQLVNAKAGTTEAKESQPVLTAGHLTARNVWIKIGLSPVEMACLRKIRDRCSPNPNDLRLSEVVRALLVSSLTHYGVIVRLFAKDKDYTKKEGFITTEDYQEGIIKKTFRLKCVGIDKWE